MRLPSGPYWPTRPTVNRVLLTVRAGEEVLDHPPIARKLWPMDGVAALAFGDFRLDLATETLLRDGVAVPLTPKAYGLLRHFLAHPGRLLSKDDLLDAVWPDTAVSDAVLKVCVAELRKVLGDPVASPRYVTTVHRRGYRFIAPLATEAAPSGDAAGRPAPVAHRRAADVVGRTTPLGVLGAALAAALAGTREVVFVTGEAGLGKTTLVEAFLDGLDPTVLRARGQCLEQYGAGEPYLPVLDALGRLCRDPGAGDVRAVLTRTAPSWAPSVPGLGVPAVASPTPSRSRMLLELVEALEQLATPAPLVLVLEDLHWSDYSTLDVLALLAHRTEPARLLVIATYRPVELVVQGHPLRRVKVDLELRRRCREIALEFLSEAEIERYLARRLGTTQVPAGLATLVHARTDGNPLFMTHVVDLVLARGWLRNDVGDEWRFDLAEARASALVPDTLRQMIAQEIAGLASDEQRLLEAASVAGVEPTAAAVAAALDVPVTDVEGTFVALARRGQLVAEDGMDRWPDGTRTARFAFIHALYQNVLYDRLPPARRRELHERTGLRLAAAFGTQAESVAAELAQHFTAAGDVPRALVHLRQAADRSLSRHAYLEAIDHLDRALALLAAEPDDAARTRAELDLRMSLGPALMAVHGFAAPPVEACYARARALCAVVGVTPERARALRGLGVFSLTRGDLVQARELAEESLALAEGGGEPGQLAKALVTNATALYYLGELDTAAAHLERARRLFGRESRRPAHGSVQAPIVNCLAFLAMTTWFRGRPDTALRLAEEACRVAKELAHPLSLLWASHVTAILRHLRAEPAAAAEVAAVAIDLATDLGLRQWTAWGVFFHGWLATTAGRLAEGIGAMQAGLDEYRATGAELGRVYFTATLAEAHGLAGNDARGLALVEESLALATARSERYYAAELHRVRAGLLHEPVAAEAELRRAVALAGQQGNRALALRAATDLAPRLGGAVGRKLLAPLYGRFREGLETGDLCAARTTLDRLDAGSGRITSSRRRRS